MGRRLIARRVLGSAAIVLLITLYLGTPAWAAPSDDPTPSPPPPPPPCLGVSCPTTELGHGAVTLAASSVTGPNEGGSYTASNTAAEPLLYTWRLRTPC